GQLPGVVPGGQPPWQSASNVPQPARADAALLRQARRQSRGVELEAQLRLHALSEIFAPCMQTLVPDMHPRWQSSGRASGGAVRRTATAVATSRVAFIDDRMALPPRFRASPPLVATFLPPSWPAQQDRICAGVPRAADAAPPLPAIDSLCVLLRFRS